MQFAEGEESWGAIPAWIDYLLWLGFRWRRDPPGGRRIALVSMPCPSAGAGVVALGAIIHRLCLVGANDIEAHFARLKQLATRGDTHILLRRGRQRTKFFVECQDPSGLLWVREAHSSSGLRITVSQRTAHEWWFDGEAPVRVEGGEKVDFAPLYASIAPWGVTIVSMNLTQSDSSLCLAGNVVGESETRARFGALRFRQDAMSADLAQLLTIQSWTPRSVSRMTYYNCRTGQLDRSTGSPTLVIADGDKSFLRVVRMPEFHQSDVIGIVDRTVDRERLEQLGQSISDFGQWYEPMAFVEDKVPEKPPGIVARVWERR